MNWVIPQFRPFIDRLKSISVCSLKKEVKVKVTKFCAGLEELINVYKLTKFDS